LGFFERAWASSRRTEVSVFDVIPILELVRVQPFGKVYPSDLHIIWDWAHAVERSIHAYDVVNIIDYALISRVPAVYAYDVIPVHDYAYASRGNVVHAYDIIPQSDTATRFANITLSVADILSIPEWFFRVNRALKVLEQYITYELATVSTITAIYADDLSIVYDLGASINAIKTASAFDKLVTDYVTYTKSYSPLFFTMFQRRPIRYSTPPWGADIFDMADYASVVALRKAVSVFDVVPATDRVDVKNITISVPVFDVFDMADYASVVALRKAVSVFDVVPATDRVDVKNITISVPDFIMYDYVPSMSPSSIRYRSLYANVGMRTISVFDRITLYESVWVGPRVVTVNARDYLVSDNAVVVKRSVHAYDVIVMRENVNIVRL